MTDQIIAALVGAAVMGGLKVVDRLLDWFLPTDHHSKYVDRYGEHNEEDEHE